MHPCEVNQTRVLNLMKSYRTTAQANEDLYTLTGIQQFFRDADEYETLCSMLMAPTPLGCNENREWGDFQTPFCLAEQVCHYLIETGVSPRVVIEPTYGTGTFILAALALFPTVQHVYGVEIQAAYTWHLKMSLLMRALQGCQTKANIELYQDNIFTHRFSQSIRNAHNVLIIGNPPWVTNAQVGLLQGKNLPAKSNIKAFHGIDALTGKSNFDIGECVLLRMLDLFAEKQGTLAILCKKTVIKNIVELLPRSIYNVANIHALEIDANQMFGASVDAALLVLTMGTRSKTYTCQVAHLDTPYDIQRSFGWAHNKFVSSIEAYEAHADLDGVSPLVWRQGLKHDCSKIMELNDNLYTNGNGAIVDVEEDYVYGLLKGSDLKHFVIERARKKVIVPQQYIGQETAHLANEAPKLWAYLHKHSEYFDRRKSSIYQGKPPFSLFGIGEYAFKAYKVAISGFHKKPWFSVVLPINNRPVMLDDTCYFLGFDSYLEALFTASILNNSIVTQFLQSIVFIDAKRPYTKQHLMRIDLHQVAKRISFDAICTVWSTVGFTPKEPITKHIYEHYRESLFLY